MVDNIPKISDLGSAKKVSPETSNSPYIVSKYYRAPELIFGAKYGPSVDIWGKNLILFKPASHRSHDVRVLLFGAPLQGKNRGSLALQDISAARVPR